ncbi:DUF4336 domain-containing protein [Myxosarcina sp. GI1]|uniref:DUF4336 domain-containing protein n=1 Tax=Myxosarcina sp. GI1 TaxID=1541065 RepID=UPI000689EB10|nr:DUF4336 domain-containing protein [Myxosarcina sp. GI1]
MQQDKSDRIPQSRLKARNYSWKLWPIVPIYPYGKRRTIRHEVIKDTIWTFDQIQGIFYVVVPIRMTVVKLANGGLLVYAPVAPTPECIRLVRELVEEHGDVKYIILPTISAVEHKVFVPPFARKFPNAQIYVAPNQWSFPVNLPLSWLGFPPKRTQILPTDSSKTPFADEFDYAILGDIDLNLGQFEEVVFLHKRSQTLLVTDAIVSIPKHPPEIVEQDLYPLLFHARDSAEEPIIDTPANRIKGWQRICLFAMYFRSSVLEVPKWREVFVNALKSPNKSLKAYFGLFPFKWKYYWQESFDALSGDGRILVAPILQTLILNRAPTETLAWADKIAGWSFKRIIPCHFEAPINTTPQEFRQAFSFLEKPNATNKGLVGGKLYPLPEDDFEALRDIDKALYKPGIVPPPKEKV